MKGKRQNDGSEGVASTRDWVGALLSVSFSAQEGRGGTGRAEAASSEVIRKMEQ